MRSPVPLLTLPPWRPGQCNFHEDLHSHKKQAKQQQSRFSKCSSSSSSFPLKTIKTAYTLTSDTDGGCTAWDHLSHLLTLLQCRPVLCQSRFLREFPKVLFFVFSLTPKWTLKKLHYMSTSDTYGGTHSMRSPTPLLNFTAMKAVSLSEQVYQVAKKFCLLHSH